MEQLNLNQSVNEGQLRTGFTNSVIAFSRRYYQLVYVENPGSLSVTTNSLLKSIPVLGFVLNGDLAFIKRADGTLGEISARISELPIEQVQTTNLALNNIIDFAQVDLPFKTMRKLAAYLPVVLPGTREGTRLLRKISASVSEQLQHDGRSKKLTENLTLLEQALVVLEDEFITKISSDQQVIGEIQSLARAEAQKQLSEAKKRDDNELINGLRNEIAQGKLVKLKEAKVLKVVDGSEREFSQLDIELDRIIEEEKLTTRESEGQEELRRTVEQRKTEVVDEIVKNRVVKIIAGIISTDSSLLSMAAKVSGITQQEALMLRDDKKINLRMRLARQLLDTPKKKLLRLGFTTFPKFEKVYDAERERLMQAINFGDPFLFIAQLDQEEFELIKAQIPNLFKRGTSAENRALFALAKQELLKRLATETTNTELTNLLSEKLIPILLRKLSQEMIEQGVRSLGIESEKLIDDPLVLFTNAENIIAAAQRNIKPYSLLSLSDTERNKEGGSTEANLPKFPEFTQVAVPLQGAKQLERAILAASTTLIYEKLGNTALRRDIKSSEGPFRYLPEYRISYPEIVTSVLVELYQEYNRAFDELVKANKEWSTDYQYCMTGPRRTPTNYFVQIDMVGLPNSYLQIAPSLNPVQVREDLRKRIYEIENSLAGYQLLRRIFSQGEEPSNFDKKFREALNTLRRKFNKPIALLAVTDQKYKEMRESEFGKQNDELLTNEEVNRLSGFDAFFGPEEFVNYLRQNKEQCEYLLYVRTSEPKAKLRNPNLVVEQPLLSNPDLRRIIKAQAITFNIDNPEWSIGSPRRINDTKAYLSKMGMAYPVYTFKDLNNTELLDFLKLSGTDIIRAKPMQASYGGYGHLRGNLTDGRLRQRLRQYLRDRGPYVIQPEMSNSIIVNETDGSKYVYIDRNYFSLVDAQPRFMGGERTLMLTNSTEVARGRIHGNESSVTAEIS